MTFVKTFKEISRGDAATAGGKGASLGEMTRLFDGQAQANPVPPGFVILAGAFEKFLEETDLNVEIDSILHTVNHKKMHTVEDASENIQALILGAKIPKDILRAVRASFKKLNAKYVAVRSSATAEDSASAAWAGQLESYLNTMEKNLLANVQKCWASLFTPRAIFYRFEKGLHKQKISVAVVVQKMIESEVSGIAFSVHPVTQDRNQLIIEAGFGLGEAIVSGQITPDSYVVEKNPRRIIDKNVQVQARGLYRASKGWNEWLDIPSTKGEKQVLSDKEILEFSELLLKIESHYGFPVDVEWAREKGKFYVVQSRPITTLGDKSIETELFLEKQHTRDYSLIKLACWISSDLEGLKQEIGVSVRNTLFLSNGDYVKAYYKNSELIKAFTKITEVARDNNKVKYWIDSYRKYFYELEPYLKKEKEIGHLEELKVFFEKYKNFWKFLAIVFVIPNIKAISKKSRDNALRVRKETQGFTEADGIFRVGLKNCFPNVQESLLKFLLPEEIFGNNKIDIKKLRQRKKGYIYFENQIFVGSSIKNFLRRKNIRFDDERIILNNKELKGQIGFPGIVSGRVKVCIAVKQISKVRNGNILVASMTTPDFIPAMQRASAFVTDEGGITSHAAIVARELKKPCIIGTKIATQVLKDGDMVEVDADKGIVKLLKRD
ncbi:MAG: PEP/pyruvate-binding domain-containing protein [Candidatus Jorgensenbacteria bacterium]|nr:PEP/pyruvate-binding domain-containing protein [Candidatus Jorgensenbacteria bacterium]